jgi:hypothetical protein
MVVNNNLQTEQNKDFLLKVKTVEKYSWARWFFRGEESYFMETTRLIEFQFVIPKPSEDFTISYPNQWGFIYVIVLDWKS